MILEYVRYRIPAELDEEFRAAYGFRRSPEFGPFLREVGRFVDRIEEMRHYEPTELSWSR